MKSGEFCELSGEETDDKKNDEDNVNFEDKVGDKEDMNSNANADIRYRDEFMENDNCCNKSGDRSLTIKTLMIKVS